MDPKASMDVMAKRKKSLICLCRESNPCRPASSMVTTLTQLHWLPNSGFYVNTIDDSVFSVAIRSQKVPIFRPGFS
jgi:hypothetical protein